MNWPWQRVRDEVEGRLRRIDTRLEHLETADPPLPDATLQDDVDTLTARLDGVRTAFSGQLAHEVGILSAGQQGLAEANQELADRYKALMLAVSDGIERTDRSERRVQAVVARARKKLADVGVIDEGVEAEAVDLRHGNGEGSEPAQLQLMPGAVDADDSAPSSVRGVMLGEMRRSFERR